MHTRTLFILLRHRRLLAVLPFVFFAAVHAYATAESDPRYLYANELLARSAKTFSFELSLDTGMGHEEAFSLSAEGGTVEIHGGGPAGILYGVQEWLRRSSGDIRPVSSRPDFGLRGTVLFLMKEANYDYQLTPKEFPWFYDRELLNRYFDYLLEHRFNTLFLWSGHLFSSIVDMPEYPDATDLTRPELLRNQEQFQWFTDECAKRNISVLLHFYNIHIPEALARSRNIPIRYNKPNDFVRKYTRYSLLRFLTEFRSVGLYVCPGEALRPDYTPEWIRDVILTAAKDSRNNPVIAIRDWGLDAERFKEICKDEYENLYIELKHNIEMIVSPVPDPRHAEWDRVVKKHIVNLHELADVKPFRWGSPRFIQEMVGEWKKIGLDGAEVYGMVSWRWPYTLDKLEPQQSIFWPAGKKLLTFDRDEIWLKAVGRYLWNAERDTESEEAYWIDWLGKKYGDERAGRWLWEWYTVTGPILPGLQNLTNVNNMNWHPTVVGKEQRVDWILDPVSANTNYPAHPVDAYFFERYKKEYGMPDLTNRVPLSVADYAERLARNETVSDAMTPDKVADLLSAMAEESIALAEKWHSAATKHQDESARFVTDSRALSLVAQAWRCKVLAALHKRLLQRTNETQHERALEQHMNDSVSIYEELVALTDRTYINATDMVMRLNWHDGLEHFKADAEDQRRFLSNFRRIQGLAPGIYWLEAEEMEGNWRTRTDYKGYMGSGYRMNTRPESESAPLRKTVKIEHPGRYTVWIRNFLAGTEDRSVAVELNGQKLPPTHKDNGPESGAFVWRKSGDVDLTHGEIEVRLYDVGTGNACSDAVVLSSDADWVPPGE